MLKDLQEKEENLKCLNLMFPCQIKTISRRINVEGPDIKGGKFHMPSMISLYLEGGAGGDVDVEGPAGKGRKFEMPKFDVSLPKLKPSEVKSMLKAPISRVESFTCPL